jgi:hypothetical protein
VNPADVSEQLAGLAPEPPPVADLVDRVGARMRRRRRTRLRGLVCGVVVLAVLIVGPLTVGAGLRPPAAAQPAPVLTAPLVTAPGDRAPADAQVAAMFAALSLPPHAVTLSGPPLKIAEQLQPPDGNNPALVSMTRWWTIPSPLTGVSPWLLGHAPTGSTAHSLGTASEHGVVTMTMISYDWPDTPGRLVDQALNLHVYAAGTQTVVQVEADVTMLPVRTPDLTIPPSVVSVVVTLHSKHAGFGSANVPVQTFGPTRITDHDRVTALVALVNSRPPTTPLAGVIHCPATVGGDMTIAFLDAAGHTRDTLVMGLSGCIVNALTAADGVTLSLAETDHGLSVDALSVLGLHWSWTT